MKILIPYFEIMGTDSYPDDATLFSKMQLVEFQGQQHWATDYTGNKDLQRGATYAQYEESLITRMNKIIITSHDRRAVTLKGGELSVDMEIRDSSGALVDVSDNFAMPVGRVGGGNYTTILLPFTNGKCSRSYTWNDAGEFEVTESMINMHLDENSKLEFSGFNISVAE